MMDLLFYFFGKPMSHILTWGTGVFVALYFLTRSRQRLSTVIYIGLLVEMVFVSLHFTARLNNIVILKDTSFQVINYTLFLLWLAHLFDKDGFRFTPTPMNIAVFVFFLFCVFGGYWSPRIFWYYACEWMSRYGASVILFFLVVNFLTSRSRWNMALYAFLAMMVVTSIYCIMQVKGYDFMSWGRIVNVSTFGNKDFAASYWTYCMPIALFMAIGARNAFDVVLYLAMAGVCFYNIYTGETRGAWVGLMALAGAWFLFESRFGRMRVWLGGWKKQAVFWTVVLLVIIVAAPFVMSEHRVETFKSIFQFERGTNIIRVYMWWTGVRMLWDEPWFGQGLGASHVTYPFFRPDRYHRIGMSHNTDYVHSEELQFLCEQGILGFSSWLAMLLVFFYICYRKLKTIDDITERYMLFGIAGAFFAGVVHDSMNVNLRWTSSMLAFWYVMGLGTRYCLGFDDEMGGKKQFVKETRRRSQPGATDPRNHLLFPAVTAAFLFMFYGQYRVLRGDWALKTTEEAGGPIAVTKGLDTLKYNPYSHSAYYKVAYHYLNENRIMDALGQYHGLLQIAPNYAQTHQNTGLIYYRLFFNSNQRKYIHQSILEFEWATILENNFDNHTKLLQLYNQVMNDSSRGRYHNQFLMWNALEDAFFKLSHFWKSVGHLPARDKELAHNEWIRPMVEAGKDYWLYRTDTVRRVGRPREEVRYAMKMAARYVPMHAPLVQYTLGTLLAPSAETNEDLVFLINMVEHLAPSMAPPEAMMQARQTLVQRFGTQNIPPLVAYAMGVFSYRAQDFESARNFFLIATAPGQKQYEFIRDGRKKYKI